MPLPRSKTFLPTALCLFLAACGGGGDDGDSVPTSAPVPAPAAYTADLTSFAIAWVGLQIAETAFDVLQISGETGNCGVSGSTAYDLGTVHQTVSGCITRTSADDAYTGGWSATVTRSGTTKTVTMSNPSLVAVYPASPAEPQLAITAGDVHGVDDFGNDTLDAFTGVGFSLDARVGASSNLYRIASSSGATASLALQNGVATLSIASAAIGVSRAGRAWNVTVQDFRSVGDQRPDQGTMVLADASQPSASATHITFGAGSALQFSSGGQTVAKSWNDADVQAALAAAKQ